MEDIPYRHIDKLLNSYIICSIFKRGGVIMGLYRYSDDTKRYENEEKYSKREEKKEEFCDPESARALKKILSLLDELNERDLRILDEIVHRALCIRSKDC